MRYFLALHALGALHMRDFKFILVLILCLSIIFKVLFLAAIFKCMKCAIHFVITNFWLDLAIIKTFQTCELLRSHLLRNIMLLKTASMVILYTAF